MSSLEQQVADLESLRGRLPVRRLPVLKAEPPRLSSRAGLILEAEAAVLLGSDSMPGARYLLYSNRDLPDGDRILISGPDLPEMTSSPENFGLVTVLHGRDISSETFYQFLQRQQRLLDQAGFMVKTAKDKIMIRAGKPEADQGFSLVSSTFAARIHSAFPDVQAVDVLWLTSGSREIQKLHDKASQAMEKLNAIKAAVWKQRGFDYRSCQLAGHCGACKDKKMCTEIRRMEARMRYVRRKSSGQALQ